MRFAEYVDLALVSFVVQAKYIPPRDSGGTLMRYILTFFAAEEDWMAMSEEERQAAVERVGAWYGAQAQAGRIVEGRRLQGARSARTVRLGRAGRSAKPLITDGPFMEAKEAVGSYAIVDAADIDDAVSIAVSWPAGGAVEVRPVMEG
jgi:hypothetical protein